MSKRVPIRSKIEEITPDLATHQCWYEPAESLARGQSPKLVSPRRLPPSRHKPVMSCNLEGSADATRRSQRPSSKSYFNQSRNQATDMTVSIPEDGLGSLRTPCRKADQKNGWVGGKNRNRKHFRKQYIYHFAFTSVLLSKLKL